MSNAQELPSIFLSHSAQDAFITRVRDRIHEELTALNFNVLLDKRAIAPGEKWFSKLHRWLNMCQGAVVLFSREALQSDWVQTETVILFSRQIQNKELLIVPVLGEGVSQDDPLFTKFKPVGLEKTQFAAVPNSADPAADVESLVGKVVAEFRNFAYCDRDPETGKWLRDVESLLKDFHSDSQLRSVSALLQEHVHQTTDEADDLASMEDNLPLKVAIQLLHSDVQTAFTALLELGNNSQWVRIAPLLHVMVRPIWVSLEAARRMVAVAHRSDPRERSLAINSLNSKTAQDYILRAYCCAKSAKWIDPPICGETDSELPARYDLALLSRAFPGQNPSEMMAKRDESEIKQLIKDGCKFFASVRDTVFLLFDHEAIQAKAPAMLRDRYEGLPFVLLAGQDRAVDSSLPYLDFLEPMLDADTEESAERVSQWFRTNWTTDA